MAIIETQDTLAGDSLALGDSLACSIDKTETPLPQDKDLMVEQLTQQVEAIVDSIAVQDTTA